MSSSIAKNSVRKPRAKKGEVEYQKRLEKYYTNDPNCANCWMAYKTAKQEILEIKREEKKKKKEEQCNVDRIRGHLSEASRMNKWSDALAEQGREPQAEGIRHAAERNLQEATDIFTNQTPDEEKEKLDENERGWMRTGQMPPYPYLCSDSDIKDMELKETSLQLTEMQKKLQEYEDIIQQEQSFSNELIQEIEKSLPYIADQKQVKKFQHILEQVAGSS